MIKGSLDPKIALYLLQADHVGFGHGSGDARQVNDLVLTFAPLNVVRHNLHGCSLVDTASALVELS